MKKLLSTFIAALLLAAAPAYALPESVRAVAFDGRTFLTNGGFDHIKLWCAFGCSDIVFNIAYKLPGTLTDEDVAVIVAAEAPNSAGQWVPIFNLTYINKPTPDRSVRGFWHVFVGDLDRNTFLASTFPGTVLEDGRWHMLTISMSLAHRSAAFPPYQILISQEGGLLRIDPQRTFVSGKHLSIRPPFASVKKWFIGAIDHNGNLNHMQKFFEGELAGLFLHSAWNDWVSINSQDRRDKNGGPLTGFAEINLQAGTMTMLDYGERCAAVFGWPFDPEDGVFPGLCMPYGPTSWIENQYQIDPNSEFVTHGYLRDARDSPYDEGALKP